MTAELDVHEAVHISARRLQTQEKLMAAAVGVFADRGILAASVEEICEEAGFTRGAFYSNFADKNELVLALLRHEMQTQLAAAQHAIAVMHAEMAGGPSADALVSSALAAYDAASGPGRDGTLSRQELLLYAARESAVQAPYRAFADECQRQFAGLVEDAIASAGLEFTVDFGDAITLLAATHNHVHTEALFNAGELDSRPLKVLLLAITRPRGPGS